MGTEMLDAVGADEEQFLPYRAVSKAAVISLVLAFISLLAVLSTVLLIVPALGLISGLISLRQIGKYPLELTGRGVAWAGLVANAILLTGGSVAHAIAYAREVPEGYIRTTFSELQPTPEAPYLPFSPRALELNGKKVFIKGYVFPDGQQYDIKQFVLVRDMGTCCFGGQPPLTHMIQVTLQDPYRISYGLKRRKLGGTFRVNPQLKPVTGVNGVYFELDADYVR